MKRIDKLKTLSKLFKGNVAAIDKFSLITVTKLVNNECGLIGIKQLDKPIKVAVISPDDWLDCIGIVYLKSGGFFLKSFISELNEYEGKHQSDDLELPLFFD